MLTKSSSSFAFRQGDAYKRVFVLLALSVWLSDSSFFSSLALELTNPSKKKNNQKEKQHQNQSLDQ
jgi:hypothetical protein